MDILIMLVKDNAGLGKLLTEYINRHDGMKCIVTVSTGKEGYELIKKQKPDIVLIDITLPVWEGLEVLRRIKREGLDKHIIKIAMSSVPSKKLSDLFKYVDYYFQKPFDIDVMVNRIREIAKASTKVSEQNGKHGDSVDQKEVE